MPYRYQKYVQYRLEFPRISVDWGWTWGGCKYQISVVSRIPLVRRRGEVPFTLVLQGQCRLDIL